MSYGKVLNLLYLHLCIWNLALHLSLHVTWDFIKEYICHAKSPFCNDNMHGARNHMQIAFISLWSVQVCDHQNNYLLIIYFKWKLKRVDTSSNILCVAVNYGLLAILSIWHFSEQRHLCFGNSRLSCANLCLLLWPWKCVRFLNTLWLIKERLNYISKSLQFPENCNSLNIFILYIIIGNNPLFIRIQYY